MQTKTILFKAVGAIAVAASCVGCTVKPPECSSKESVALVEKILRDQIENTIPVEGLRKISKNFDGVKNSVRQNTAVTVSNIRVTGYDKASNKYSCAADVTISFKQTESITRAIGAIRSTGEFLEKVQDRNVQSGLQFMAIVDENFRKKMEDLNAVMSLLPVEELDELSEVDESGVSAAVEYNSTFSHTPGEEKMHYLEIYGADPLISGVVSVAVFGGFHDKKPETTNARPSSEEYKGAYECAMESLKQGYGAGPAAFCIGNSRDPSDVEIQAYEDAERDFAKN